MISSIILALIPAIVVLILGMLTRRVIFSLVVGIFTAGLIAAQGSPVGMLKLCTNALNHNIELDFFLFKVGLHDAWNSLICIFLLMLGSYIALLKLSGSTQVYANFLRRYVKSKRQAESSSLFLSMLLFIDDYFSSLTVGTVMRPIADSFAIPRIKLAFLVDSMAAPLAILCPFSTWVAAILGFLRSSGIQPTVTETTLIVGNPFNVYLSLLPFMFYSALIILATYLIVGFKVSYGAIGKAERELTEVETTSEEYHEHQSFNQVILHFFLPIGLLIASVIFGLLYSGQWSLLGGDHTAIQALQNSQAPMALFIGGLAAFSLTTLVFFMLGTIRAGDIYKAIREGIKMMLPSVIILLLAWTLGDLLKNELHVGTQIAELLSGLALPSYTMIPAIFFVVALALSFTIGSSWGTSALLFPVAVPLLTSLMHTDMMLSATDVNLLYPTLGAILSGAIAGDHISPISDTTIMSSCSTGCQHLDHVYSQFAYTIPVIVATLIAFLLISLNLNVLPGVVAYMLFIGVLMLRRSSFFKLSPQQL